MSGRTLYMQIYDYYKSLIESGDIKEGERLPSICRCAEERGVSKTTVEQAYMCLCDDGYVVPKRQSGYYVSKRGGNTVFEDSVSEEKSEKNAVKYDFSSSGVDAESFDLSLWRRYMKSALRRNEELLFYGEPQGEYELRKEIAAYVRQSRNCVCSERNIVIGAGVQTLLHILCPLIGRGKTVYFENAAYMQGKAVFSDYGFKISDSREKSGVLYVSPSHSSAWGGTMSVAERFELTDYAKKSGKLIIEDDYASEFRYFNRPTPSLQGLDGGQNTVYLGTFSKLLLPSIRISFMILPKSLMKKYEERRRLYSQTVSKADQIALCSYIRDGHLAAGIRKSRKLYAQKTKLLAAELIKQFGDSAEIIKTDSPLYLRCNIYCPFSTSEFSQRAKAAGVAVIPADTGEKGAQIAFSVSAVSAENFEKAAEILKNTAFIRQ